MNRDALLRASARCWERAGHPDRAAQRYAQADAWADAGRCWADAGRPVDAAGAYARAGEPLHEARQWLTSQWPERARRPYRRLLEAGTAGAAEVEARLGLGELKTALGLALDRPDDEALRRLARITAARGRLPLLRVPSTSRFFREWSSRSGPPRARGTGPASVGRRR